VLTEHERGAGGQDRHLPVPLGLGPNAGDGHDARTETFEPSAEGTAYRRTRYGQGACVLGDDLERHHVRRASVNERSHVHRARLAIDGSDRTRVMTRERVL
jgi:hypothetical protein